MRKKKSATPNEHKKNKTGKDVPSDRKLRSNKEKIITTPENLFPSKKSRKYPLEDEHEILNSNLETDDDEVVESSNKEKIITTHQNLSPVRKSRKNPLEYDHEILNSNLETDNGEDTEQPDLTKHCKFYKTDHFDIQKLEIVYEDPEEHEGAEDDEVDHERENIRLRKLIEDYKQIIYSDELAEQNLKLKTKLQKCNVSSLLLSSTSMKHNDFRKCSNDSWVSSINKA